MKYVKKIVLTGLLLLALGFTILYREDIFRFVLKTFIYSEERLTLTSANNYSWNKDFYFVQPTDNFRPENKQDLLNIYYSVINSGQDEFTFFCPRQYSDCLEDVSSIANNKRTLSHINNFVHPFNSFSNIETTHDNLGRVSIRVHRTYTSEEIEKLNALVDYIEDKLFTEEMSVRDKILIVHDYIIDHTRYDTKRADYDVIEYDSHKATGVLFYGVGLCGGYTDAMALFLTRMNIPHFQVASENHIWNAVYLDGVWYHLDLTWNDPVTEDGTQILLHTFFLISTEMLLSLETEQHYFDKEVYKEVA